MPIYRSIKVVLHSQLDVDKLQEFFPEPRAVYAARGIHEFIPELVDEKTSTCSVYVPILPGSLFWISYSVFPPVPKGQFFVFKLSVNDTHVVTWSTGKDEGWKGKTMFGLFEDTSNKSGRVRVQKRALRFTPCTGRASADQGSIDVFDKKARIEIKVNRAHSRRRIERQVEIYGQTQLAQSSCAIDLVNAGRAGSDHPKRFYQFALIDPIDRPFATFCFYYRTWEQIQELGFFDQYATNVGEECDLSVIEPSITGHEPRVTSYVSLETNKVFEDCVNQSDDETQRELSCNFDETEGNYDSWKTTSAEVDMVETRRPSTPGYPACDAGDSVEKPLVYIPSGAPLYDDSYSDEQDHNQLQRYDGSTSRSPQCHRGFSMMQSSWLDPPEPGNESIIPSTIPWKQEPGSSTSSHPYPAYHIERWALRTPSPVKSIKESIKSPPLEEAKRPGRSPVSFMSIFKSSWKRRGEKPANLIEGGQST